MTRTNSDRKKQVAEVYVQYSTIYVMVLQKEFNETFNDVHKCSRSSKMLANLPKFRRVVTWRGGWNYLGCARYLTYCNFTYNPFGRYIRSILLMSKLRLWEVSWLE